MIGRIWLYAFALALVGASSAGQAATVGYTKMFVFGDSLSDTGNVYELTAGTLPAPPYSEGRFADGPLYVEYMAARLGLPLNNVLSGGTNYAFGGAGTNFSVPVLLGQSPLSVENQVNLFRAQHVFSGADPQALYILFAGGNNLQRGIAAAAADPANAAGIRQSVANEAVNDIIGMVGSLHQTGARHFLVPNVPPLGAAPTNAADRALADAFSIDFNTQLAAAVASLGDPKVILFDTFGLSQRVFADPLAFGFADISGPCLSDASYVGGGTVCSDPDQHLFWDDLHLTTAGHDVLAGEMLSALQVPPPHAMPIPASIYLFGAAVAVLGAFSRRRRHAETQVSWPTRLSYSRQR
jgi:outer membrane lipase/esterase